MMEFDVDINNHDYFVGVHDDYDYKVQLTVDLTLCLISCLGLGQINHKISA